MSGVTFWGGEATMPPRCSICGTYLTRTYGRHRCEDKAAALAEYSRRQRVRPDTSWDTVENLLGRTISDE